MVELRRVARPRLQIVASRGQSLGQSANVGGSSITRVESRYRFRVGPECHDIQLVFANFTIGSGTGEADGPNPITVRAAIETEQVVSDFTQPAAAYPLLFDGAQARTIDPSANAAITDPLGIDFAAGATAWVRTAAEITAGQFIPVGFSASLSGTAERAFQNSNATNQVYTTGELVAGTNGTQVSFAYGPAAILGVPRYPYPAVAIWGDSITQGQGDLSGGDGAGNRGYATRGLALANIPWVNLSRASDTPAQNRDAVSWRKRAPLQYATDVLVALGINQIGPTAPAVQIAYLRDVWDSCKRRGLRVHQCLVSCQTSGTFADAAGQTINAQFAANRATVNAAIIDAAAVGLIDGYLDPGAAWEDPANPGKFLPNATTDGTHPASTFHVAAATIVQAYANLRIV